MTSHAAVVARGLGRACVSGATELHIDFETKRARIGTQEIKAGDVITIDGSTGRVIAGRVAMREPELTGDFATLMLGRCAAQASSARQCRDPFGRAHGA